MFLIKEMLEQVNESALREFNQNMDLFIGVIEKLSDRGQLLACTRSSLLMKFVWHVRELPLLMAMVHEQRATLEELQLYSGIVDYLEMNAWNLDKDALEEYFEMLQTAQAGANADDLKALRKSLTSPVVSPEGLERPSLKSQVSSLPFSSAEDFNIVGFLRRHPD